MDPDPIDIYYIIDECILELKDKYGSFINRYAKERPIIDFDSVDVNTNFKKDYYTILTMYNHEWVGDIRKNLEEPKLTYPIYGNLDDQFYQYYKENNGEIDLFYTFLVGFEYDYISEISEGLGGFYNRKIITEKLKETSYDLGKNLISLINTLKRRYDVNIIRIEEYPGECGDWVKKGPNINSLSNIKYPRIELSFSIKNR